MKTKFSLIISIIILGLLSIMFLKSTIGSSGIYKPPSSGPVKVQGRSLLVDFDGDGIYRTYLVKGVGYSPYPIGRHPSDWGYSEADPREIDNIYDDPDILNRDFTLLQQMYSNTIRIWKGDDTEDPYGRFPCKLTQTTLNLAQQYNIKVVAGFWVNTSGAECINGNLVYHVPDFTDPVVRNDLLDRFEAYVNNFKDHPAILFWAIGNENNLHLNPNDTTQIQAWYSLVNEMAQRAYQVEGANYHPVAVVNGDLSYIGDTNLGTTDTQMDYLDIWGINVYRGDSFGTLFDDFADLSGKPLWISEYGLDAWHTNDPLGDPSDGQENEPAQAQWVGSLWDEIVGNRNISIGGNVMEYSDEWWKPYEWIDGGIHNDEQNYFGTGLTDNDCPPDGIIDWYPPAPDNHFTAEWWGIMAIAPGENPGDPDIMLPRQVYDTLKSKFRRIIVRGPVEVYKVEIPPR